MIYIILLIALLLPSYFLGLIKPESLRIGGSIDNHVMIIGFSLILIPYLIKNINIHKKIKYLFVVVLFILFQVLYSLYMGINFNEIGTTLRYDYYTPIIATLVLAWAYSASDKELVNLFRYILVLTVVQLFFFIVFHLTGFNIFQVPIHSEYIVGGKEVARYNLAFPRFTWLLALFLLYKFFKTKSNKYILFMIFPLLGEILTSHRSSIIAWVVFFFIVYCFTFIYNRKLKVNFVKLVPIFLILLISIGIYFFLFPEYFVFLSDRFAPILANLDPNSAYNFQFRIDLINRAYDNIINSNILFGMGYQRAATYGQYDLAFGRDTGLAAVLYTEGMVGLFVRFLPIIYLIKINYKDIKISLNYENRVISILSLAFILSQLVNIVQTQMFRNYMLYIFVFFIIEILKQRNISNDR